MRLSGSLNSKDFPAKWLLLQLAACWLNWLFRVPLRAGRRLCLVKCPTRLRFNILSKSAGLKVIFFFNRVKKRWFLDVVIIQTMSFRWSEPLLFLDTCRKFYPPFHLPTTDMPQKEPRFALMAAKRVAATWGQRSNGVSWQLCRKLHVSGDAWRWENLLLALWCIKCSSEIARCSWKRVIFCSNQLQYIPSPLSRH